MLFQWLILYVIAIIAFGAVAKRYIGTVPAVALAYALLSGAIVFASPYNMFMENKQLVAVAALSSLNSVIAIISVFVAIFFVSSKLKHLPAIIAYTSTIDCIYLLIHKWFFGVNYGLIQNPGINGNFIAATIPALIAFGPLGALVSFVLGVVSVVVCNSSTGYGVMFVSLFVYLIRNKKRALAALSSIIFVVGYFFERDNFLSDSGRFRAYKIFLTDWLDKGRYFFGTGLGTFMFLGPIAQCKARYVSDVDGGVCLRGNLFVWAHSDWFQVLYECGVVGFVLLLLTFIVVSFRLLKTNDSGVVLSFVVGIAASAVFNFPVREVLACLFLVGSLYYSLLPEARLPRPGQ